MKVHNLTIDSSQHTLETLAMDYVVELENPIYDCSSIKLISARIPTPQLTICETNKTFSVDGKDFTLLETNYTNGSDLAQDLNTLLTPTSNITGVVYDSDTDTLKFSGTPGGFTFEFLSGTNGRNSTDSSNTTPHQVMGFGSRDYTSNVSNQIESGAINLKGPNALVLRLTVGRDECNQSVYSGTPFYTGHILLDGSDFINFNGADDPVQHYFHTGSIKSIRSIRIQFFYMSHGRLIPYDFRNQEHVLKFELVCSTDKLENLERMVESIDIPEPVVSKNVYRWNLYIVGVIIIGILLMFLMKGKPSYPRQISE
jgi:hypothetical protein